MASPFDDLDAAVSDVIAETMGEAIRIIPRTTRPYVGPAADPDRASVDLVGVYTAAPIAENLTGQRESSRLDTMSRMTSARHEVWVPASEARRIGAPLASGDLVVLLAAADGRPAGARFSLVGPPRREAAGDLRLIIAPEDAPP